MPNTTNFNWATPADTDLVKDGALAIRTLGSSIDTSLVDLKGGTTDQVLAKNSNTDMDFKWVTSDDANAIQNAIVDAKGDLIAASAADTPVRLAAGTNEHRLVADSAETAGLKYVADTTNYAIAAKGDLLVGTAADTLSALSVGTNGHILVADSVETTGLKWVAPAAAGGMTLLSTTTLSSTAVTLSNISQDYENLFVEVYGVTNNTADTQMRFGLNSNMTAFARGTRSFIAGTSQTIEYSNGLVSVNNMKRTGGANTFNLYITDYKNTSNYKQLFAVYYYDGTSALQNQMDILYYVTNTNAITSVTFDNNGSQTFTAGTMRLWGIK
jgi:hypothetical protein